MNHEEIQDLLAPFVLGAASPEERASVEAHLPGCPDCRGMLDDFRAASVSLSLSVPPAAPPARIKATLMEKVRTRRRTSFSWFPSLAMAASVLLLAGFGWMWRQQSLSQLSVVAVTGGLTVDGRDVQPGDKVGFKQRLAVAPGGAANIRLAKRAAFRLSSGSVAVVTRSGKGYLVELESGGILSLVKTGTPYAVRTSVLTTSALGTVFYVQADSPDKSSVCICRGRISLDAPGFSKELAGETHNPAAFALVNGSVQSVPLGDLYHPEPEDGSLAGLLE